MDAGSDVGLRVLEEDSTDGSVDVSSLLVVSVTEGEV